MSRKTEIRASVGTLVYATIFLLPTSHIYIYLYFLNIRCYSLDTSEAQNDLL